jgi:hypothetical protein
MMTPLFRITVLATLVLYFTACGTKSGGGSPAQGNPAVDNSKTEDGILKVKGSGAKRVLINTDVDLGKMLVNAEGASYEITEGAAGVHWVTAAAPILHVSQGGKVTIKVHDATDQVVVTLKLTVVFDTAGLSEGVDTGELPQIPVEPGLGGLL